MAEPMDHSGATNKAIMRKHMYECGLVLKKASDMVNIEMVVSESLEQLCLPSSQWDIKENFHPENWKRKCRCTPMIGQLRKLLAVQRITLSSAP